MASPDLIARRNARPCTCELGQRACELVERTCELGQRTCELVERNRVERTVKTIEISGDFESDSYF